MSNRFMKTTIALTFLSLTICCATAVRGDTFGTGVTQFIIDFGPISSGYGIANDYRMGVYEITNDQWDKFEASLGVPVTGNPANAYDEDQSPSLIGVDRPISNTSWYEAAQFVNWLNTSTNHHAAYNFTGTQGASDYSLFIWDPTEAAGGANLYRHKDAYYFLPTEQEWVKAGYWNGAFLQNYATKPGDSLFQGDGSNGGWNYGNPIPGHTWDVGSGSEELNGTYDLMGNVWEWMESPLNGNYNPDWPRIRRGGAFNTACNPLPCVHAGFSTSSLSEYEGERTGFRVASISGPALPTGDFDDDGDVDGADFLKWQLNDGSDSNLADWQATFGDVASPFTAASTGVPEPTMASMLALGSGLALLCRRRKFHFAAAHGKRR